MHLFSIEHGRTAYLADFAAYGLAILAMAAALLLAAPAGQGLWLLAGATAGLLSWSGVEYLLHRHVLHGWPPFCHWHDRHHARPMALIGSPTLLSAALFAGGVFAPLWGLAGAWTACAVTMGMMAGYLAFGLTHHAMHHSRSRHPWLARRKRWHALHHHLPAGHASCYGVTSSFWDRVFGTVGRRAAGR